MKTDAKLQAAIEQARRHLERIERARAIARARLQMLEQLQQPTTARTRRRGRK